jgi:tetratricopeptide (TPR) repeat protein
LAPPLEQQDLREFDNQISMLTRRLEDRSKGRSKSPEIWKKVIDVRSNLYGDNDNSIALPTRRYAEACEAAGDNLEAESAFKKLIGMHPDNDKTGQAHDRLVLAHFYLRHQMFEEASSNWQAAAQVLHGYIARDLSGFVAKYQQASRLEDMNEVIDTIFNYADNEAMLVVDKTLCELFDGYIRSGNLERAESLAEKRVAASNKCTDDRTGNDWRLRLSDLYLAAGRTEESEALFQRVTQTRALQGLSNDLQVQKRAKLLVRLGQKQLASELQETVSTDRSSGSIRIEYTLCGVEEVRLGNNTTLTAYNTQDKGKSPVTVRFLGPHDHDGSSIASAGTITCEGNVTMHGKLFGQVMPAGIASRLQSRISPAPDKLNKLPNALAAPTTAIDLSQSGLTLGQHGFGRNMLTEGDYVIANRNINSRLVHRRNISGRVRIFLTDDERDDSDYALIWSEHSMTGQPADLQFWYNGVRKLIFEHKTYGVVYAPHATVEIKFNGHFTGAIVANRIIGEGNNHFVFDQHLLEVVFTQ